MRNRILIWLIVIIIGFTSNSIYKKITTPKIDLPVSYIADTGQGLLNLEKIKISGYKINFTDKDPTVIIKPGDEEIPGYTMYKNAIYSPLVMYTGDLALEADSGFSVAIRSTESSSRYNRTAQKDLSVILEGIEKNKTWQDLGFSDKVLTGKVILSVPDKNNPLRDKVRELFMINLVSEITPENYDAVYKRAENILNKCKSSENIINELSMTYKNQQIKNNIVAISTENIMQIEELNIFSSANESVYHPTYFIPVYPTKTVAVSYSLYIKDDIEESLKTKIIKAYNQKTLTKKTGFRTTNANTVDCFYAISSRQIKNLNINYIEKVGDKND